MIEILEAIVRDPDTPATARITAIRTLNQIAPLSSRTTTSSPTSKAKLRGGRGGWRRMDCVPANRRMASHTRTVFFQKLGNACK
jgi:hypothetical protein